MKQDVGRQEHIHAERQVGKQDDRPSGPLMGWVCYGCRRAVIVYVPPMTFPLTYLLTIHLCCVSVDMDSAFMPHLMKSFKKISKV